MKKLLSLSLLIGAFLFTGCVSPSNIDAGEEGVMTYKPWIFGHGGVDPKPLVTGMTWTVWSTEVTRVSVKPFNINERFDDLITKDNNPVDFDVHLTFQHQAGKTPVLVEKFGMATQGNPNTGWYASKLQQPLRNDVREFVKDYSMFEISTDPAIANQLQKVLANKVGAFLKANHMPTDLLQVSVGKVMPPQSVVDATLETAAQKQRVLTQEARVKAEQSREIAERASAEADKAYMQEMGMTASQYIQMKQLEIIEKKSDVHIFLGATPQPMITAK